VNARPPINRTRARRRALKPSTYFLKMLRRANVSKRSEADIRLDLAHQLEETYFRHESQRIADELMLAADHGPARHQAA